MPASLSDVDQRFNRSQVGNTERHFQNYCLFQMRTKANIITLSSKQSHPFLNAVCSERLALSRFKILLLPAL